MTWELKVVSMSGFLLPRTQYLIEMVFSKGTVLSVSDKSESVNERNYTDQRKIPHSRGLPEVPMNSLGNRLIRCSRTRACLFPFPRDSREIKNGNPEVQFPMQTSTVQT